ncbi:glycosyltransferase [Actinomycetospora soli]|uniref:glycosyltransferase n=1 Tax=Actinomycetospora soli TaxID=2893887 RepID=UPI0035579277
MRVAVDGSFLYPSAVGGAEHMFYALLESLATLPPDRVAFDVYVQPDALATLPPLPANFAVVPIRVRFVRFLTSEFLALTRSCDVYLSPNYYTPMTARLRPRMRTITVVHDLQFRCFPENFTVKKRAFLRFALWATMRLCDDVVAISEFTRGELGRFYRRRRPVHKIPNSVLWRRFEAERVVEQLNGKKFLLLAAAHYPHKNIATAVRAFNEFSARSGDAYHLALTGQLPANLVGSSGAEVDIDHSNTLLLGYVDNRSLAWLYRNCTAVLLPTRYEGFGLPAVEAIGLNAWLIHSNVRALQEVLEGVHSTGVAPMDVPAWTSAISYVVTHGPRPRRVDCTRMRRMYSPASVGSAWSALLSGASVEGSRL